MLIIAFTVVNFKTFIGEISRSTGFRSQSTVLGAGPQAGAITLVLSILFGRWNAEREMLFYWENYKLALLWREMG